MHNVKPMKKPLPVRDVLCPTPKCHFKTHKEEYLKLHQNRVHCKTKEFSCQICPYTSLQKADVARHVQRVHVKVSGGKIIHKCDQCPSVYSKQRVYAQHVNLVHCPKEHDQDQNKDDTGNDLPDDSDDVLKDDLRNAKEPDHSTSEIGDQNPEEEEAELAAKERELADKEAELRDYERIVEQSEEEAEKAAKARESEREAERARRAEKDLHELKTKKFFEYLCQKVGREEAKRIFKRVTE